LRYAPALLCSEHQATVLRVLLHQHREIVRVERKQHPALRGGAQQLLRIGGVTGHPRIRRTGDIVSTDN
jgi:hypothetical protein